MRDPSTTARPPFRPSVAPKARSRGPRCPTPRLRLGLRSGRA